jgi:ribosome-associated protein
MVRINRNTIIPENELNFRFSSSSKPGGQNVNRVNTRVTLLFDVDNSTGLSVRQKQRVRKKLGKRINKEGILQVSSQRHRSQSANREDAIDRLATMIRNALRRKPPRKKTQPPKSADEKRIKDKKRRGRLKRSRKNIDETEE